MDSEVNSSLLTPLTTHDSVKTGLKNLKKGKSAHMTWVYTCMACNRENSRHKFCIYYTVIPLYSTLVSTNICRHLKSKHGIYVDRTPGPI